jgi:hypothetical protein
MSTQHPGHGQADDAWPQAPTFGAAQQPGAPTAGPGTVVIPGQLAADEERPPQRLLDEMLADPVHAPERLAIEAVARCGPEAARWVTQARVANPQLPTGDLAMQVRDRFVRLARLSGAAGGALGLADVGVLAWNNARMIVHLAAVHGFDPTDEERAAEILYFTDVYKAIAVAEQAVEVASRRAPAHSLLSHSSRSVGALALSLGRMLGKKTAKRLVTRAVPFASIPLGAWSNDRATAYLADRVVLAYARRIGFGWDVEKR